MDFELPQGAGGVWAAIAVQQVLYGLGWAVAGRWVPGLRASAQNWMAFALMGALTMLLLGQRGQFGVELGAVLLVLAQACVRRATELFFHQAPRDREHLAALLAAVLVVAAARLAPEPALVRAVALPLLLALLLARGVAAVHADLRREFGATLAWTLHGPLALLGLAALVRAAQAWRDPAAAAGLREDSAAPELMLLGLLVTTALLHFSYAGMVVLRLVRRLRQMSHHDALTGLLNRRAMDELLQQEWQRHERYGEPYAVVLGDLDHFRRVNDTLGHGAGDEVLAVVAGRLQSALRPTDRLARYGGEEFLVLMPATDHAQALAAAERLRARVATQPVTVAGKRLPVTLSLGVAQARVDDGGPSGLVGRADRALYFAKSAGRNRALGDAGGAEGVPPAHASARPAGPGTPRRDRGWSDSGPGTGSGADDDRAAAAEPQGY